ncbi:MAG: SDR family NAD(P)-dependent oxidoreductase [Anaerolineales bacterium]|nr:SDR family NAD(P)-dependent oxidoreductase [Anaerolineales bacterium]
MNAGRTAVITGASSGIGKAFAHKSAAIGYPLMLIARNERNLRSTADALAEEFGAQCTTLPADLSLDAYADALAERIAAEKSVCLLVNNAGFAVPQKLAEARRSRHGKTTGYGPGPSGNWADRWWSFRDC